ncbi:MAG: nuclear transport factor 2 family protein [Bacteroidetes bacterium]|nr:MAG: nuclear transport factor 2 family protein [Bacteroidota bacterium]
MFRSCLLALVLLASGPMLAQRSAKAEQAIRGIMADQEKAWNQGNLEAFMDGYWHADSLKFIGSRGLTYGWQQTLDNYKKGYPDRAAMGNLTFTLITVDVLSSKSAFVIGKWHLQRQAGDLSGHFTLLWKKIRGKWLIVADHSS